MKKIILSLFVVFNALTIHVFAEDLGVFVYTSNQKETINQANVVREYVRDETCYAISFIKGFTQDDQGRVHLTADYQLKGPGDTVLFEKKNFTSSRQQVPENQPVISLEQTFEFSLEPEDSVGMYVIEVEVTDHLSSKKAKTKSPVLFFDTRESLNVIMAPVYQKKHLDALWAEYHKTKNTWAIKQVIFSLRFLFQQDNPDIQVLGEAAKMSLVENGKKYPDVLQFYEGELKIAKGSFLGALKEIVRQVKE